MAISWPFDSTVTQDTQGNPVYSRTYSADVLARILGKYFRNGVFSDVSTGLQAVSASGMNVTVKPGDALINGRHFYEDTNRTLTVQAAHATLDRIDTVALRLNLAVEALTIDLYVVKGTPAATPAAPALTRNVSVWELGLANLYILKNSTAIPQQRITDTRLDSARCGVVASILSDTDTSAYYAQVQADLASFKAVEQAAFDLWFTGVQNTLGENAAGNLLNLICYHAPVTYLATFTQTGWSAAAPYTQTVAVTGLLATDEPVTDIQLSANAETAKAQLAAYACVSRLDTAAGTLTATCYDNKPSVALLLSVKVNRSRADADGTADGAITASTVMTSTEGVTVQDLLTRDWDTLSYQANEIVAIKADMIRRSSYGVLDGLEVLQQTTPDMSVTVTTGRFYGQNGVLYSSLGAQALAVNAAHATYPRVDIIFADTMGGVNYLAGTAAASPVAPALPVLTFQLLAEINVPVGTTAITTAAIVRKAKSLWMEAPMRPTMINGAVSNATDPVEYVRDIAGRVLVRGRVSGLPYTDTAIFTLPVGYRPKRTMLFYSYDSTGKVIVGYISLGGSVFLYATGGYTSYISLTGLFFLTTM